MARAKTVQFNGKTWKISELSHEDAKEVLAKGKQLSEAQRKALTDRVLATAPKSGPDESGYPRISAHSFEGRKGETVTGVQIEKSARAFKAPFLTLAQAKAMRANWDDLRTQLDDAIAEAEDM